MSEDKKEDRFDRFTPDERWVLMSAIECGMDSARTDEDYLLLENLWNEV